MILRPIPITAEAFAPFGHLARNGVGDVKQIRNGSVALTKTAARCAHDDRAADFALDFYDAAPVSPRLDLTQAERHPVSSQFFLPLNAPRYLVVVWSKDPAGGACPYAFEVPGSDVVVYHPGTWHHGIVALDQQTLFLSGMWKTGQPAQDTEFRNLPETIPIEIAECAGQADPL